MLTDLGIIALGLFACGYLLGVEREKYWARQRECRHQDEVKRCALKGADNMSALDWLGQYETFPSILAGKELRRAVVRLEQAATFTMEETANER